MRSLNFHFSLPNPCGRTIALDFTQPPSEMTARNILNIIYQIF
jgi:hypothetical protein